MKSAQRPVVRFPAKSRIEVDENVETPDDMDRGEFRSDTRLHQLEIGSFIELQGISNKTGSGMLDSHGLFLDALRQLRDQTFEQRSKSTKCCLPVTNEGLKSGRVSTSRLEVTDAALEIQAGVIAIRIVEYVRI